MNKKLILLLLPLILISFVLAEDYCYSYSKTYGSATASVKICETPLNNPFTDGANVTFYCNSGSQLFYGVTYTSCTENGCGSPVSSPFTYYLKPSDTKVVATCWKKKIASNGDWAWASASVWYDSLRYVQCVNGQERCSSTYLSKCVNNAWVNQGIVKGKCGAVCSENEEVCSSDFSLSVCKSNQLVNKGRVLNKCGYTFKYVIFYFFKKIFTGTGSLDSADTSSGSSFGGAVND